TECLRGLWERGKTPLLVGGTGFYYDALINGLPKDVLVDREFRLNLNKRLESDGLSILFEELQRLDPEGALLVDKFNPRRILRALEIIHASGKSLVLIRDNRFPLVADCLNLLVTLPKPTLDDRIESRIGEMMKNGLREEVQGVFSRYGQGAPAFKSIGYSEWKNFFKGAQTLDETVRSIVVHTRQYAKRQMTWFRKRPGGDFLDLSRPGTTGDVFKKVEEFLEKKF
ncbi:tRNA (adenosine(37)-N6)-dimethylallyltransferase MiaA, partial [bacterium]|nr:tRNA (adenosine(37)-N6)-dimethylallyltransferase MiaA [bacterium]